MNIEELNALFSDIDKDDESLCTAIADLYNISINKNPRKKVEKLAIGFTPATISKTEVEHVIRCLHCPVSVEEYILLSGEIELEIKKHGIRNHRLWQSIITLEEKSITVCGLLPHVFEEIGTKKNLLKIIHSELRQVKWYEESKIRNKEEKLELESLNKKIENYRYVLSKM